MMIERTHVFTIALALVLGACSQGDKPADAKADAKADADADTKTDTKAELELQGVTGLAVIQFSGGKSESPLLKNISRRQVPQIQASLSPITQLLEGSGNIVASVQRLLTPDNTQTVARILADIETITDAVAANEDDITRIIDNMAMASDQLADFADTLDERKIASAMAQLRESYRSVAAQLPSQEAFLRQARAWHEEQPNPGLGAMGVSA